MIENTTVTVVLSRNSSGDGQETLLISFLTPSIKFPTLLMFYPVLTCTGGGTRTPNPRFWRPVLCQLSYTRVNTRLVYSLRN